MGPEAPQNVLQPFRRYNRIRKSTAESNRHLRFCGSHSCLNDKVTLNTLDLPRYFLLRLRFVLSEIRGSPWLTSKSPYIHVILASRPEAAQRQPRPCMHCHPPVCQVTVRTAGWACGTGCGTSFTGDLLKHLFYLSLAIQRCSRGMLVRFSKVFLRRVSRFIDLNLSIY